MATSTRTGRRLYGVNAGGFRMWLRIPVELLAWNSAGGQSSGGASGGAGAGTGAGAAGTGGTGEGTGGTGGTGQGGSGDGGSGDGSGGDGGDGKAGVDENSAAFKAAVAKAVEGVVEDRLARDRRAREAQADRDKQDAAAQALKENQKFEELAKTRETQLTTANASIATLTAERDDLAIRVKAADEAIGKILDVQIKDLPAYLKPLLDKMTPAERLTYLADNAEAIKKGSLQAVPNHSGTTGAGAGASGGAQGLGSLATSYVGSAYGQRTEQK